MHDQPSTVAVHTGEPEVQGASSVRTAGIHSLHAARARAHGELAARCVCMVRALQCLKLSLIPRVTHLHANSP